MAWLIWPGAAISLLGLAGLVWCILAVMRAKRRTTNEDELRAAVQKVMPINMGALLLSVIGLMLVILGIFLG